ncbi:hypothetical protein FRC12_000215 [Ceratobasidium sp. 428]|nr:hypothetical protein FRC12_000215 [Ceratobasidium sp. 428]
MQSKSLPRDVPSSLTESAHEAYSRLLPLEAQEPEKIRICGWMLICAPSLSGQLYVAECINRCTTSEKIFGLGNDYRIYFLSYFRMALHRPTPASTEHPSRPSLDDYRDRILDTIHEAPKSHGDAKRRALVRDDYKCMLSGYTESTYYEQNVERLDKTPGIKVGPTECSHILPQYVNQGLEDGFRLCVKLDASATVWTVLSHFGEVPPAELSGKGMHRLANIMTLKSDYHKSFDSLHLWLESTSGTNTYKICRSSPVYHPELPSTVTFRSKHPEFPLPDPRYLALHAACARVVHLSGAAKSVDRILDDATSIQVLSGDGSSSEILTYLLSAKALTMVH